MQCFGEDQAGPCLCRDGSGWWKGEGWTGGSWFGRDLLSTVQVRGDDDLDQGSDGAKKPRCDQTWKSIGWRATEVTRRAARFPVWGQIGGLQVIETQLKPPPALGILGLLSLGTLGCVWLIPLLSSPLSHFRTYVGCTRVLSWQWEGTQLWAAPGLLHLSIETPEGGRGLPQRVFAHAGTGGPGFAGPPDIPMPGPVTVAGGREGCLAERRADLHHHGATNNRWKEIEAGP